MCKLYLLPVSVFFVFQVTFITTYVAAVLQGHVVPTVPYISDAATYSPESCMFGQLIEIGNILLGVTMYLRYLHVIQLLLYHKEVDPIVAKYNRFTLYCGIGICIGISIVGNFQETNVRVVHYLGAFCCFGCGTVYFLLESLISLQLYPMLCTKWMARIRFAIAIVSIVVYIITMSTGFWSHLLYKGRNPRKWVPSDGGWELHVISSVSEWIMATLFSFYVLSFTDEFRDIRFHPTTVTLFSHSVTPPSPPPRP